MNVVVSNRQHFRLFTVYRKLLVPVFSALNGSKRGIYFDFNLYACVRVILHVRRSGFNLVFFYNTRFLISVSIVTTIFRLVSFIILNRKETPFSTFSLFLDISLAVFVNI